jgi:cytidyltransferase-like protein
VKLRKTDAVNDLLAFYMGTNTMERQNFIIDNLVIEEDKPERLSKQHKPIDMKRAIFPGTFDPFTIGHDSIVRRALSFFDEIIIGVGINENKNAFFPIEKRVDMIQDFYKDEPRIKVKSYNTLPLILH